MIEEEKQDDKCIGDLTTHKVKIGQVWRNNIDSTDTKEILDVKSPRKVKIKHCYETFGAKREPRCEVDEEYYDPWIVLHEFFLTKDPKEKEGVKK